MTKVQVVIKGMQPEEFLCATQMERIPQEGEVLVLQDIPREDFCESHSDDDVGSARAMNWEVDIVAHHPGSETPVSLVVIPFVDDDDDDEDDEDFDDDDR